MSRPIYFVSLGPGDAELITLKSLHALQQADIIYCPSTVRGARQNLVTCRHPVT